MIVLPGGGYHRHAPHEGEPVAEWLRGLGHLASVFGYPVLTRHPAPRDAVRAEVRRVRQEGAARVALLGFSAGGHAAGMAAYTSRAPEERVDAVVLGYAVVSMLLPTHRGSRVNLLGEKASWEARGATSLDQLVTSSAPPSFVWHTAGDPVVPVQHSYLLGMALAAAGVPHELHVLPGGVHGVGRAEGEPAGAWTRLCADWLARL